MEDLHQQAEQLKRQEYFKKMKILAREKEHEEAV